MGRGVEIVRVPMNAHANRKLIPPGLAFRTAMKCIDSSSSGISNARVAVGTVLSTLPELTTDGPAQMLLRERAAAATREHFGRRVFVRAVVELSNFCREHCAYCGMSRDNTTLARYRARADQLADLIINHRPASVTDLNLQAGEDPVAVREVALPLIRLLRSETNLGISVCLGTLSPDLYDELRDAGASIYILKFECADAVDYAKFQAPGTQVERLQHIRLLAKSGWVVSSGFIVGLPGQDERTMRQSIELATSLPLRGCSVSPFIPGESTLLASNPVASADWTLNAMAALRVARPDWVIPAVSALNLAARDGYRRGLQAGANLVTINLTPEPMRENYVIYKRDRFIMTEERVLAAIEAEGLVPSDCGLAEHYRDTAPVAHANSVLQS
jgi:biotin synthase